MAATRNMDTRGPVKISSDVYGTLKDGQQVLRFTLENDRGMKLSFITLGGIMTELWVPDRNGKMDDILLGYKDLTVLERRMNPTCQYPHFGALIGRVAGRISGAKFSLDGNTYSVSNNNNGNCIHGGEINWSRRLWTPHVGKDHVRLDLESADGDQGFPGDVTASVTYSLTNDNGLVLNFSARVSGKDTPINLTSHGYFNLAGESSSNIYKQKVQIFADKYSLTDWDYMPTGEIGEVSGTGCDLREERTWGDAISRVVSPQGVKGLVVCYSLRGPEGLRYAARMEDPDSGRVMKVYTDQIGLQIYTAEYIDVPAGEGKHDHAYGAHSAFCMETQNHPDAVNQPAFPDSILRQGSEYRHTTVYQFSTV